MSNFTPIVITSRKAKRELERIKTHHKEILANLEEHKKKVEVYHQQRELERKEALRQEMEQKMKDRIEEKERQKEMLAHQMKMKELEIKRAALSNG